MLIRSLPNTVVGILLCKRKSSNIFKLTVKTAQTASITTLVCTFPLEATSSRASVDAFLLFSATYRSLFSHPDHDRQPNWAEKRTQTSATDAELTRLKQRQHARSTFSVHTIVVHASVLAQGGQVEAFPQAVAVPYLNKRQHSTTFRQNVMGPERVLTSSSWPTPVSLTTARRPRTGESALSNLKSRSQTKKSEHHAVVMYDVNCL